MRKSILFHIIFLVELFYTMYLISMIFTDSVNLILELSIIHGIVITLLLADYLDRGRNFK